MADMFAVASKEFSDMVRSRRFIILIVIFGLIMIIAMATIYVQVRGSMPRMFVMMVYNILVPTLLYFAPVLGVALGCDTISGEREKGTLKLILSQPVYRDTVINGKFVAATSALSLAVLIASLMSIGASIMVIGVTPTAEETLRTALFLPFSILFTMTYYSIAAFISTISKKTSQSVILSIAVWAVFTFAVPVLASLIAFIIAPPYTAPPTDDEGTGRRFSAIVQMVSSITPNYHFNKIGEYLLTSHGFTVHTTPQGVVREDKWSYGSVTTCLICAGPNILVLVIVTALVFIFSYITFTRQEVR